MKTLIKLCMLAVATVIDTGREVIEDVKEEARDIARSIPRHVKATPFALAMTLALVGLVAPPAWATLKLSTATRNAMMDAITLQVDGGTAAKIEICSGTIETCATDTNGGCTSSTLLAELTMSATSFGASSSGVITAAAITQDSSANATGTATYFIVMTQTAGTCVYTGSVGTSGADLNLNTVSIVSAAIVSITAATITAPNP